MNTALRRIAAALAVIIGAMAIFAGGQALLGNDPGYYVINWLPVYNYTIGVLTVFVTAPLIWRGHRLAVTAALGTVALHALVMFTLQLGYGDVVAAESIRAMTIRLTTWAVILVLMLIPARRPVAIVV